MHVLIRISLNELPKYILPTPLQPAQSLTSWSAGLVCWPVMLALIPGLCEASQFWSNDTRQRSANHQQPYKVTDVQVLASELFILV